MIYLIFYSKAIHVKRRRKWDKQSHASFNQSSVNNGNHPRNAALAKEIGCLENTNITLNKSTGQV